MFSLRQTIVVLSLTVLMASVSWATTGQAVQDRIDSDIAAGKPIVVHVVVALCDNINQGIVPVPPTLGNGQDPPNNLYWGALYGIRTHLPRAGDWKLISAEKPEDERILERIVLHAELERGENSVPVYVVADAWDGAYIRPALQNFLGMTAGQSAETVKVSQVEFQAGGSAHLLAYIGHNGLMEFSVESVSPESSEVPARSALILACISKSYFADHLKTATAHPLLLTTGLMAPEAYTFDSTVRSWVGGASTADVVLAAATAYDQYQKCGLRGARRLFWGMP